LPPSIEHTVDGPEPSAAAPIAETPAPAPPTSQGVDRSRFKRNKPRELQFGAITDLDSLALAAPVPQTTGSPLARSRQVTVNEGLREWPEEARQAIDDEMAKMTSRYNVLRTVTREEKWMLDEALAKRRRGESTDAELVIVYCKMFLKAKFHANGTFDRIAARLVGGGHTQPDSSYGDTFAPATDATTKLTATFAFFAYAAKIGKADRVHTWSFDINGAFLHCKLDSKIPVFARLPPNIGPLSNQLVRVLGGLYGLKQVNRTFYLDLVATMTTLGFVQSDADECLFIRSKPGHPHYTVVYFHVDDGHALSLSEAANQFLIDGLTARYGELKLDKEGASHAGWCIERTPTGVTIHQAGYIASLAEKYSDLISAARGPKPNVPHNSHLFEPATDATPVPQPQYQELIGCLMHAKQTRHDCCLVLSHLASKNTGPVQTDLDHAIHLLRYLVATPRTGPRLDFASAAEHGPRLFAYVDASFASHPDSRSHGGYKFTIGPTSGSILSRSNPLADTASPGSDVQLSTCEAEYVMLCYACMQAEWLRLLLATMGFPQDGPTVIYEDNEAAISMAHAPSRSRKTRHINIKFHYVKSLIAKRIVAPTYIDTALNHADMISKANLTGHAAAIRRFNNQE